MFKRFKDRLNEVSEEVKRDPRFVNGIASVNQLAQQTVSALKSEKEGSNENLQVNFIPGADAQVAGGGQVEITQDSSEGHHRRSQSSDLQNFFNQPTLSGLSASASSPALSAPMASNNFFSLTEDDDAPISEQETSPLASFSNVDLQSQQSSSSPIGNNHRARRLSSSSMSTEAANLFPIYESPQQIFSFPVNADLDSTAGSEWEEDAGSSQQRLTSVSKEQLFQMLQKARARYHKYKGRYTDLSKAFQDLERENGKIKGVMQQTQDKALRRISELKEQCQLEQKAKRHLEEELRSDLEEKQHVIEALQTKVSLLKSGGKEVLDENDVNPGSSNSALVDISDDGSSVGNDVIQRDGDKIANLEEKIKRLEGLLTKCKESIKANKLKTTALTEVKESLAKQVGEREAECDDLRSQLVNLQSTLTVAQEEISNHKKREQSEELQIAELKLTMHQEMITKDEEISKLRLNLKSSMDQDSDKANEIAKLKEDMEEMRKQQVVLEQNMESEKATALQEISRGKSSALQALNTEMEKRLADLTAEHEAEQQELRSKHETELSQLHDKSNREKLRELSLQEEDMVKKLRDKEEEGRLALEELELRLSSSSNAQDNSKKLIADLETAVKSLTSEKERLTSELKDLKSELNSVCSSIQNELKEELSQLQEKLNQEEKMKLQLIEEKSMELKLKNDLEKQIFDLQNRETSLKGNEQNMIAYQKELQDKISKFEHEAISTKELVDKLHLELKNKQQEVLAKEQQNQAEIAKLKADLDLKIRHEREKETSFKDLQVQSIEYQKKLQEQLTDMEKQLDTERMQYNTTVEDLHATIETLQRDKSQGEQKRSNQEEEMQSIFDDEKSKFEAMITELQANIEKIQSEKNQGDMDILKMEEDIRFKVTNLELKEDEITELKCQMGQLEEKVNHYQSELILSKEENENISKRVQVQEFLEAENSELKAKLEAKLAETEEHYNQNNQKLTENEGTIKNLELQLEEQEKGQTDANKKHKNEIDILKSQIAKLEEDVNCYKTKLESSDIMSSKLLQTKEKEQEKLQDLIDNISRLETEVHSKQIEIAEKEACINQAQSEHETSQKELLTKLELAQQMMYDAQNAASSKDSEIEDLRSNIHVSSEELEGMKKELKSCQTDKAAQLVEFEESLVTLEKDNQELKSKVEQLQEQVAIQSDQLKENQELGQHQSQIEDQHEQAVKNLVKKYEHALSVKDENHDLEMVKIREDHEVELKRTVQDLTTQIATLRQDLFEKSAMYDQVIETHQREIRAKQEEIEDEVAHCTRMYQSKISQVQSEHQERLRELEQRYQEENNSWNWERAASIDEEVVEDLQRTPTREQREEQLRQTAFIQAAEAEQVATLTIESHQVKPPNYSLEEATEFEYLKNVLYQYMLGKESLTLARVLATVVKFSPEELQEVVRHEEKKHSLLASMGLVL